MYEGGDRDEYKLEPVSKNNISQLRKLQVDESQQKYVATIDESLIQASFLKNWHGYVLRYGNDVVGFGSFADYEKQPGSVKVYKVIVDKNHQGKGHGSKLIELLLGQIHCPDIYIDLYSDNFVAKRLYIKHGFSEISDNGTSTILKIN
jgi:diamine N-acetyltransferase